MWHIKINKGCNMLFAGLLTKKFVSLIQEAKDRTLDLNKTAEVLEVYQMSLISESIVRL